MRVLLTLPPGKSEIHEVVGVTEPPLGLAYLAAVARDGGHDVHIIDGIAERLSLAELGKRIVSYDPEMVGGIIKLVKSIVNRADGSRHLPIPRIPGTLNPSLPYSFVTIFYKMVVEASTPPSRSEAQPLLRVI